MKGLKYGLLALAMSVTQVQAGSSGNSGVNQDYLGVTSAGKLAGYTDDAMGKITLNCNSGDFVFRGHGMVTGQTYVLKSKGHIISGEAVSVGKGTAGVGSNVLIKGNLYEQSSYPEFEDEPETPLDEYLGDWWYLWEVPESGPLTTRVMSGRLTDCND